MVSLVSTPSPCTRLSSLLFWRSTAQAWCVRACVCVCVRACEDDGGNSYSSEGKKVHQSSLSLSLSLHVPIVYLRYLLRCESQESTLTYLGSNKRLGDSDLWYCTYLMLAYVALHSPTKQQCMCLCRGR